MLSGPIGGPRGTATTRQATRTQLVRSAKPRGRLNSRGRRHGVTARAVVRHGSVAAVAAVVLYLAARIMRSSRKNL